MLADIIEKHGRAEAVERIKAPSLAEVDFDDIAPGKGPSVLPKRQLDPRIVAEHFAPLLPEPSPPETRWKEKASFTPFPGV